MLHCAENRYLTKNRTWNSVLAVILIQQVLLDGNSTQILDIASFADYGKSCEVSRKGTPDAT